MVAGVGQVDGDGLRFRGDRFGLGGESERGAGFGGGALGVGQGRWAGAHLCAVAFSKVSRAWAGEAKVSATWRRWFSPWR